MAYIEENIKKRRVADGIEGPGDADAALEKPADLQDELYQLPEKFRTQPPKPVQEGSVTNSLAMLTAIPEVDLGMECVHIFRRLLLLPAAD